MDTVVVPPSTLRPIGSGLGLRAYGLEPRWVIVDGPAGRGTARLLDLVRIELGAHIARICPALAGDLADELASEVQILHSPGASLQVDGGGSVTLRQLIDDPNLPHAARFGLYMTDRVLHNRQALELLRTHPLVVQGRGGLSTYAYQCAGGNIPTSLFVQLSRAMAPELADLLVVLSPADPGDDRVLNAYANPPMDVLRLCARRCAFIATDGRDAEATARRVVDAIAGGTLSFAL